MKEDQSPVWQLDLVELLASLIPHNEVACVLRLVSKATAAHFQTAEYITVRMSQLVPHHAFVRRWGDARALRRLTWRQRRQLLKLTARSGSLVNLEALLAFEEYCPLLPFILEAAAGAGHLAICQALRERGCPFRGEALDKAAGGGHRATCEWLLACGCPWSRYAPGCAAAGGHAELADWLMISRHRQPEDDDDDEDDVCNLIRGAAKGCDMEAMQRLFSMWVKGGQEEEGNEEEEGGEGDEEAEPRQRRTLSRSDEKSILGAAVRSLTSDWQAKVEYLEARGFKKQLEVWIAANLVGCADWAARLEWLRQRGYLMADADLVNAMAKHAAYSGNAAALATLLQQALPGHTVQAVLENAAEAGHVHILDLLAAQGVLPPNDGGDNGGLFRAFKVAVREGHVAAADWLAQALGPEALGQRIAEVTEYDNVTLELLIMLHGLGWPLCEEMFSYAAASGSKEALEWLAEHGCPMPTDGGPYTEPACKGDLSTLNFLRRLGCPVSDSTHLFRGILYGYHLYGCGPRPIGLAWLLENGFRVDLEHVGYIDELEPEVLDWLRDDHQRRQMSSGSCGAAAPDAAAAAPDAAAAEQQRQQQDVVAGVS
ncbi:hypothetical protein PLESTF_000445200 [Pleodorina starrii]|nr:hypothetical protein PLESTF_000445200 [Pleodorina starrii]